MHLFTIELKLIIASNEKEKKRKKKKKRKLVLIVCMDVNRGCSNDYVISNL